jgi:hypothetical protein
MHFAQCSEDFLGNDPGPGGVRVQFVPEMLAVQAALFYHGVCCMKVSRLQARS